MTVGRLKEILSEIPDNYDIAINVGEEGDSLNHVFIDNDFGFVEFSDFIDEEESKNGFVDVYKNELKENSKVVYIQTYEDGSCMLRRGKILEFNEIAGDDHDMDLIIIEDDMTGEKVELYKKDSNRIMLYKW